MIIILTPAIQSGNLRDSLKITDKLRKSGNTHSKNKFLSFSDNNLHGKNQDLSICYWYNAKKKAIISLAKENFA